MKVHTDSVKSSIEREEGCMADLKREARRARKRVEGLDLNVDLDQLRDHLPEHLRDLLPAWNIMRQREEEAASKGFFSGFLLGVVVGAVLALIFAPQRGEDTRGLVKDKATELVHQVRGEADEARADLSGEEPAIEREFGATADTLVASAEDQIDEAQARI
jgi:gas vesicle protein